MGHECPICGGRCDCGFPLDCHHQCDDGFEDDEDDSDYRGQFDDEEA